MKTLLTLLLLTSVYAKGQTTDTVKVIMLVCDTSLQHYHSDPGASCWNCPATYYSYECFWQLGYQVRRIEHYEVHKATWWADGDRQMPPDESYDTYEPIQNLDDKKRPLTLYVWQSKQIK